MTEQSILNDQFKNAAPNVQWIKMNDLSGLTTTLKCSQFFGLLTGSEGMEKKIPNPTLYLHRLRIKVTLYLYNTIPLNQGLTFTINNVYVAQLYNLNSVMTMDNGYILKKTSQTCTGVGSGQLYVLMIVCTMPVGDFTMRIQGNMQITTVVWGITQIQIVAGNCQQQCITCLDSQCTQCQAGYYIYQGLCTNSMPPDLLSVNSTHILTYEQESSYSTYLVSDFIVDNIKSYVILNEMIINFQDLSLSIITVIILNKILKLISHQFHKIMLILQQDYKHLVCLIRKYLEDPTYGQMQNFKKFIQLIMLIMPQRQE